MHFVGFVCDTAAGTPADNVKISSVENVVCDECKFTTFHISYMMLLTSFFLSLSHACGTFHLYYVSCYLLTNGTKYWLYLLRG